MSRRALLGTLAALVGLGIGAPAAFAHAQLQSTSPGQGAVVPAQPRAVIFRFDQAVEGKFGAIKVFDARARRVDDGNTQHPGSEGSALQSGLQPHLPPGTYTATYRVISADGHPVEGGVVFSIGRPGRAATKTIDQLIGSRQAGPLTRIPFGLVRSVDYLALAMAVGLLSFLLWCWRRGLAEVAGGDARWRAASSALAARAQVLLLIAVVLGILSALLGLVFEGATAAGTTFWGALDSSTLRDVLATRFGAVWGLKALVWTALGAVLVVATPVRALRLRPVALGADGQALARLGVARTAALTLPAAALTVAPALAGHATTSGRTLLLVPSDVVHVLAMSVWLGGLAALVLLLPRATAELEPGDRSRLLAAVLVRFSPLALGCVLALMITGTLQSILYLHAFSDFLHDAFGRAVLIKIVLLLGLSGLGAVNRLKVLPRLRQIAADGGTLAATGHLLRRTLRRELAVILGVLIVTGALVGYAPPSSSSGGGAGGSNITKRLGAAQLEVSTDPARVGPNTMHVYLFDAKTGAPYTSTREITLSAGQPAKGIGPLPIKLDPTGPGHYTAESFQLVPGGRWTFTLTDRVSDFDQSTTTFTVEVGG